MAQPMRFTSALLQQQRYLAISEPACDVADALKREISSDRPLQEIVLSCEALINKATPAQKESLNHSVARELMKKEANRCKEQFANKGTVSSEEIDAACQCINSIGKLPNLSVVKKALICEIFSSSIDNLSLSIKNLRESIEKERPAPSEPTVGFFSNIINRTYSFLPYAQPAVNSSLIENKLKTLAWMEECAQEVDSSSSEESAPPLYPQPSQSEDSYTSLQRSYVDLACAGLLQSTWDDQIIWSYIPRSIQRDVLRHCLYLPSCGGKAEQLAARFFGTTENMERNFRLLNLGSFTAVNSAFVQEGEKLLNLYYSSLSAESFMPAYEQFLNLPADNLFAKCASSMADLAQVPPHRKDFRNPGFIPIAMQALEWRLHTEIRY